MRKSCKKRKFTLVELIVAMAVFSILLLLMLQFFSGAQTIWRGMEKRNEIYANARIAMDLMTTHLQNTFYHAGIPFRLESKTDASTNTKSSEIYFITKTGDQFPGNSAQKYMTFQFSESDGILWAAVFCDTSANFKNFLPPYETTNGFQTAWDDLPSQFTISSNPNDDYSTELIKNVASFEIIPYELTFGSTKTSISRINSFPVKVLPYMVEIKFTVFASAEDYTQWKNLSTSTQKDDFLRQHGYTFARTIYLGNWSK